MSEHTESLPENAEKVEGPPEGYRDISVAIEDIARSALWLALALIFAPVIAFLLVHGGDQFGETVTVPALLAVLIPGMLVSIVLHEGLHALGWMIAGRVPTGEISFGFDRASLSPYAHVSIPMRATPYRFGAALPLIILGVLPWLWGMIAANGLLTFYGAMMTSAAVGDIFVLWVIRSVPGDALVLDHPSRAGCYVKVE